MQENPWDLPDPPGIEPVSGFKPWRSVVIALVIGLLLIASALVPIPIFVAYLPGPVKDIEKLVHIDDAPTYSSEGDLYLTTVSLDPDVTVLEWLQSLVDPDKTIV